MRTPAMAVLWESWRLSRRHLLGVMLFSLLGCAALLIGRGPEAASFATLLAAFLAVIARVWADEVDRRTGFTMVLGFRRPIPTWVLVGVPMAYIAVSTALAYLLPMLLLMAVFDIAFPLVPVAAAVATLNLVVLASQWWTRHAVLRVVGRLLIAAALVVWYLASRALSLHQWDGRLVLGASHYAGMAAIAAVAFELTVFGVARQRRGDDIGTPLRRIAKTAGDRRTALVAKIADAAVLRCPVSSPASAQLWFEARTSGLRVVRSGILTAVGIVMASALAMAASSAGATASRTVVTEYAPILAIWTLAVPLVVACRSVLGVRRKQGVAYFSAFDAARPMETARLVSIKVGTTSVALLLSWTAIWAALSLAAANRPEARFVLEELGLGWPAPSTYAIALVLVPVAMAWVAAVHAFLLLNVWRVLALGLSLCGYLVALIYAVESGRATNTAYTLHVRVLAGAGALALVLVFRNAFAHHIVTARYVAMALAAAVGFAFSAAFVLNPPPGGFTDDGGLLLVLLSLLGLLAMILAPWSLSRIRHR